MCLKNGKNYLDLDKNNDQIHDNVFLNDYKIVIKVPLLENQNVRNRIKIKKFNLSHSVFLTSYYY